MGLIRGGLALILGTVLLVSLIAGNIFLTLSLSSSPENLKEELASETGKLIESAAEDVLGIRVEEVIDEVLPKLESHCENNTEYVFSEQGYTITIPCETVQKGKDAIIEEGISDIVDEVYEKEYECESILECISDPNLKNSLYFISEGAKQEWKSKFNLTLLVSTLLIVIMFFLVSQKIDLPIIVGFLIILSSLPILGINKIISFLDFPFIKIIPLLFSESDFVFLLGFVIGIALMTFGILAKFFNFGYFFLEKINNLRSKKVKKNKD